MDILLHIKVKVKELVLAINFIFSKMQKNIYFNNLYSSFAIDPREASTPFFRNKVRPSFVNSE